MKWVLKVAYNQLLGFSKTGFVFVLILLLCSGCDSNGGGESDSPPFDPGGGSVILSPEWIQSYENPTIRIAMQNAEQDLFMLASISPQGFFSKEHFAGIPAFGIQLESDTHRLFGSLLQNTSLPDDFLIPNCPNTSRAEVEIFTQVYRKSFADQCGLRYQEGFPDAYDRRRSFFHNTYLLYDDMTRNSAPWTGLQGYAWLDTNSAAVSDKITAFLRITNPTDSIRTVYFPREQEISLSARWQTESYDAPLGEWHCPPKGGLGLASNCLAPSIEIQPGEMISISREFSIIDFGFNLPQGRWSEVSIELNLELDYFVFQNQWSRIEVFN